MCQLPDNEQIKQAKSNLIGSPTNTQPASKIMFIEDISKMVVFLLNSFP